MDFVGTAMGIVTIPMALLTVAGVLGGLWLLLTGKAMVVAAGLLAICLGVILAAMLERMMVEIDGAAWRVLRGRGREAARPLAILAGALPVGLILAWEAVAFVRVTAAAHGLAGWLWSYGVATLPWTIFALSIHGDRRTLCGIRAYAGHLAFWLLSLAVVFGGARLSIGLAVMLLPAILPFVVGMLLAVADRDALRNVRI